MLRAGPTGRLDSTRDFANVSAWQSHMKQSDHSLAPGDMVSGLEAAEPVEMRAIHSDTGMQSTMKARHA